MMTAVAQQLEEVPLGDVIAGTKPGFAIGKRDPAGVLQVRMNNVSTQGALDLDDLIRVPADSKQVESCSLEPGDVLFNNTNSTELVGKSAIFPGHPEPVTFSNHFTRLKVHQGRLDPRYLARWLTRLQQARVFEGLCTRWVGQSAVKADKLLNLKIPLPYPDDPDRSLTEQRRIADILDKADAIRRKRQQAVELVDDAVHSAFLTMVGPASSDHDSWPIRTIASLAEQSPGSMRTGPFGSDLRHSEFVSEGVAVLGIDNAVQNRFAWGEERYITAEKYEKLERYTVYPSDVIVTIMGTTGRSAVVPDDIPTAITTKHLACITLDRREACPEFISNAIHRHPAVLSQIGVSHRGAIMPGLNLTLIKSLELRVPPIDRQRAFARTEEGLRRTEIKLLTALRESESLFNSLTQRAFRGDL